MWKLRSVLFPFLILFSLNRQRIFPLRLTRYDSIYSNRLDSVDARFSFRDGGQPRENRESTTYCTRARSQIDQIALYYENVIEWNKSYSGCLIIDRVPENLPVLRMRGYFNLYTLRDLTVVLTLDYEIYSLPR